VRVPRTEPRRSPSLGRRAAIGLALALALVASAAAAPTAPAQPAGTGAAGGGGAGAAAGGGAGAAGGDFLGQLSLGSSREPIHIAANQLDFDYQSNRVTYKGSVRATQGELVIDSDTLTVTFDRAEDDKQAQLREVIAQGNVVITQGTRTATGGTAVFSQTKRQVILLQDPVLRDGPNEVSGDRIIVYLDEGRSVVESSPKKRVSAVLFPGSTEGGIVAPAPAAGDAGAAGAPR
jgi:lipopolysaccharide export system protein LptA